MDTAASLRAPTEIDGRPSYAVRALPLRRRMSALLITPHDDDMTELHRSGLCRLLYYIISTFPGRPK